MTPVTRESDSLTLDSASNVAVFTPSGALERLEVGGLSMLLYPASLLEDGLAGLWLRRLTTDAASPVRLSGPGSTSRASASGNEIVITGADADLRWRATFRLAADADAWFWHVCVTNDGPDAADLDLVWATDAALATVKTVRTNEYYVSQYLDLTPVETANGTALAVRQNMPGTVQPWLLLGGLTPVVGWATDALQFVGPVDARPAMAGLAAPDLPNRRLQHEHTLATLRSEPVTLAPGATHTASFYGFFVPDHPDATSPADAKVAEDAARLPEAAAPTEPASPDEPAGEPTSLFATAPGLDVTGLTPAEAAERLSPGPDEVVTVTADERAVLRPHGHILRTGHALTPETDALTSTIWMSGTFASQVCQGNVARDPLITGRRTYVGLQQAQGLRLFVDAGDGWRLLVTPSSWALRPGGARWLYETPAFTLEITADAPTSEDALRLGVRAVAGRAPALLVAMQLADASGTPEPDGRGVRVPTEHGQWRLDWSDAEVAVGGDEQLFTDGRSRGLRWLTLRASGDLTLELTADTIPEDLAVHATVSGDADLWGEIAGALRLELGSGDLAGEVESLSGILPWFAHNALIHYLSPRGLEQYTGGAWGTRDVCQGPVGLLTALARPDALRATLRQVFAGQNGRGDWPQAFDFLPPVGTWEQYSSHGDVILWPLLALGEYLLATADASLLAEEAGFTDAEPVPVGEHVARALALVGQRTIAGSPLPAYGHGDWNDSLQPADPALAERMASTWTATLQCHALGQLAAGLRAAGGDADLADHCSSLAAATRDAMTDLLLVDGLLAGYGVFDDQGSLTELLVHPTDARTGLTYGVLPWIHAISADLLAPDQARAHLDALSEHLLGPDGARLFDRPPEYRGGPMEVFKRGEAGTFWGREIGLMYTHAHLRYAEALARFGDAEGLFRALCLANPRGLAARVPQARRRQETCYYSSSDGAFTDRYDAAERYPDLMAGGVDLEGGWRIYSSGPGLFLRLVTECLLGVRVRGDRLEVDPVLDPRLDGLVATLPLPDGRSVELEFAVGSRGCGVASVAAGGRELSTRPLANPYRPAGVSIPLGDADGRLQVRLG